jgi:hypothetical protein
MRQDYSEFFGEIHYASIPRRILCEELLGNGRPPPDYKLHCFNGEVGGITACLDRGPGGRTRFDYFDVNWKRLDYVNPEIRADREIPRPPWLDEIIAAATILSRPFPYVRVDFMGQDTRFVLNEMTFTPLSNVSSTWTDLAQRRMGERMVLPGPLTEGTGPFLT